MVHFAELLKENSTLTKLNLRSNGISAAGIDALGVGMMVDSAAVWVYSYLLVSISAGEHDSDSPRPGMQQTGGRGCHQAPRYAAAKFVLER